MRLVGQQQHEGWVQAWCFLIRLELTYWAREPSRWPWEWRPQEGVKTTKKSKTIQFGPPSYGVCD